MKRAGPHPRAGQEAPEPATGRSPASPPAIPAFDVREAGEFRRARNRMLEALRARGISDAAVLSAMGRLPRQIFAPEGFGARAYGDHALPVLDGQTLTQPHTVALCAQEVRRAGARRVLEVGTGSGYQAAVLALLCPHVFSVERHPRLLALARANLDRLGLTNVALLRGDGSIGWSRFAPYDVVVVAAAAPRVPAALLSQLTPGGRLLAPVGGADGQELMRVTRQAREFRTESLGPCSFVPLLGERGGGPADAGSGGERPDRPASDRDEAGPPETSPARRS
ncbi:MAG: protein-L-isoaspartate(D-aspartate) O-methyltransferase [Gemmatimonadota bacterium]